MSGPITPPLTVTTASGTPSGRPITTIKVSDGDLTISGGIATIDTSGSGGSPATPADAIQYNSDPAGTFTASSLLTWVNNLLRLGSSGVSTAGVKSIGGKDMEFTATQTDGSTAASSVVVFGGDTAQDIGLIPLGTGKVWISSGELTTSSATTNLVLSTYSNEDKAKITLNAGSNGDVDIQTEGTGITEIQNATTDNDTTLSVKGNGTGDAKIDLNNPTKAISLICDTNQKLKVQGGVNTFIFDASSATGGIQWPDGTIQTTAASGGGLDTTPNIFKANPPTGGSDLLQYPLFAQFGTEETTTNGVCPFNTTTAILIPFFAPKTGDVQSITCKITLSNDDDVLVSMYDSDADNLPQDRIGDEVVWDMGTAGEVTLDVSGATDTWNLTTGDLYYLAMMLETDTTNRPTFYVYDAQNGGAHNHNLPSNDSTTATYKIKNTLFQVSSLSAALPASITTSDLAGKSAPFYNVPIIGVVM